MLSSATAFFRVAGLLLGGLLLLGQPSVAQAPLAWVSAQGNRPALTPFTRRTMDAAGNLYEAGTLSGNCVVAGVQLFCQGNYDGYLVKYTPTGTVAWLRQFSSAGEDQAKDVAVDAAGNAYVVGIFSNTINLGGGQILSTGTTGRKVFIVKYDPAGNPLWAQQNTTYPNTCGPMCPPSGYGYAIQVDATGHVSITGSYYGIAADFGFDNLKLASPVAPSSTSPSPTFLARFSAATGQAQSVVHALYLDRTTGATVIAEQQLLSVPDGGTYLITPYYMAPYFTTGLSLPTPTGGRVLAAKYNAAGQLEWVRTFGSSTYVDVASTATDASGNLYITGTFEQALTFGASTLAGRGSEDGYLVKFSPQGVEQWAQALASPTSDYLQGLCFDATGNVYVTGSFGDQAHLGANTVLTSAGQSDILVAAYTPQGQLSWVQQAGGSDYDDGLCLGFVAPGRLRVVGYASYRVAFGAVSISNGMDGGFMAELAGSPLAAAAAQTQLLALYPNPASAQVHLPGLAVGTSVQVLDALGRLVRTTQVAPDATLSVQGLPTGLYLLQATDAQNRLLTSRLTVAN